MRKQKARTKKSLSLASEPLRTRTLLAQDLRLVAGGYTNESNAGDRSCAICDTDICEF